MKRYRYFDLKIDERGVATLTFDTPQSSVNLLSFEALSELEQIIKKVSEKSDIQVLLIKSAKDGIFVAGADIHEIEAFKDEAQIKESLAHAQRILNSLEALKCVTIVILDGATLGGGLELAMACDWRIATNSEHTRLALPEVTLGIIPGLGGTQRLFRLVGFAKSIELITAGKRLKADKALKLGLIDASVPAGYLKFKTDAFVQDVLNEKRGKKKSSLAYGLKWYEKIPFARSLIALMAKRAVTKKTHAHYAAPLVAIDLILKGADEGFKRGLEYELDAFAKLATSTTSKNLIKLFFTSESLKKERFSRAKPQEIDLVVVVGVGTMGSAIAWLLVYKDIAVRLKARTMQSISKAYANIRKNFDAIKRRGRLTEREIGLKIDKITHTTGIEGVKQMDIAIEAVSEKSDVKRAVFKELESQMSKDAIISTNTSSLSVTKLAESLQHPDRLVGMHFFNPVAKMPLVEIIAGKQTSQKSVATVVALAKRLGKVPIKVSDSAGFLVNRILLPYLNEAALCLEEGATIEQVDTVMVEFGMPMGPFKLADEVGIDIGEEVSKILLEAYGKRMPKASILNNMIQRKWLGKKSSKGFYVHNGKHAKVNVEVEQLFGSQHRSMEDEAIKQRCMLRMINEAAMCLEEKVVKSAQYLDIAMVIGTGFPAFRGGVLRYADELKMDSIVEQLEALQEEHGIRFAPAKLLKNMAKKQKSFYDPASMK